MAAILLFTLVACDKEPDIRTVADFDAHPCALFTDATMSGVISAPYIDLAGVDASLVKRTSSVAAGDTYACTYTYKAIGRPNAVEVTSMTVTVAHAHTGSQPYSVCVAGATAKAGGYRTEKIGDQACLSPSSDLWMKIADQYVHVVVVPQPGFASPVDANQALAPIIFAVAQATADRMPKK